MYAKILLISLGVAFSSSAIAAKTYTPIQLRSMVNSGNYPDQGEPSTQTQLISFTACISKVKGVMSSISGQYPNINIVNTSVLYTSKLWANDAAMTLSCSAPDRKLIITSAKYK